MDKIREVRAAAADRLTQVFYTIGQHLIGQDDGSVADMVEEMLDFNGTVALPMVDDLADEVGYEVAFERVSVLLDPERLVVDIQPVCGEDVVLSEEEAVAAAAEMSHQTIQAVYSAFPELGDSGLERHLVAARRIAGAHLRSEANFRAEFPSAPAL